MLRGMRSCRRLLRWRCVIERHQCLLFEAVTGAASAAEEHHHEEACEAQAEENGDGEDFHAVG